MLAKYLLTQHVGDPCKPLVRTGDKVKRGMLIAEPGDLGANIHASINGVVKEVSDTYILIEGVGEQSPGFIPIKKTADMFEAIKEAGVVGAGGAGFPAHVKYGFELNGGTIICNCAECEPLLMHNIALRRNNSWRSLHRAAWRRRFSCYKNLGRRHSNHAIPPFP